MEKILGMLGAMLIMFVLNLIWKAIVAAGRTATGSGSFSDNFDVATNGMGKLQMRIVDQKIGNEPDDPTIKALEVKGLIPNTRKMHMAFVTSVIDVTDDQKKAPVLSMIDKFQEHNSACYQHLTDIGPTDPNLGYVSWVRAGILIPDILQTPYSGQRKLMVILRLIDLDNPPSIEHGFHDEGPGLLWAQVVSIDHIIKDKGYVESRKDKEEAERITIQIGVAVAMTDGDFDESEGLTIKRWIEKLLTHSDANTREKAKATYNEAFKEAYVKGKSGELGLPLLLSRLNSIGDKKCKYDVIDLCYEIVAADGKMEAAELKSIQDIASSLGLDYTEIQKIRDHKIVGLNVSNSGGATVLEILGVQPEWSEEQVAKHLRQEFQKWNSRLNSLPEGPERENAQRMLDLISDARSKVAETAKKSA